MRLANPAALEIYNIVDIGEVTGMRLTELYPTLEVTVTYQKLREAMRTGKSIQIEASTLPGLGESWWRPERSELVGVWA